MAAYADLIAYIQNIVRANGNEEITGTNMQAVLLDMVGALGMREFRGVATLNTNPGMPEGQAVYIASQVGLYQYFGIAGLERELFLLVWNATSGLWEKHLIVILPETDKTYRHFQNVPAAEWTITHSLAKYPSVTIIDSSGNEIEADVAFIDNSNITITFTFPFAGIATLN